MSGPERITLAVTGASGMPYALRLLDCLVREDREVHFLISKAAQLVMATETDVNNVRQLRNVLRTLAALCEGGVIEFDELPVAIRQVPVKPTTPGADRPLEDAEKLALLAALEQQRWHMTQTAAQLGISRNTLYRKLRKHGVKAAASAKR